VLLGCTLAFALASTIRYEGWIFSGSFFGSILFLSITQKRIAIEKRTLGKILFTVGLFPIYWLKFHAFENGEPLGFMGGVAGRYILLHGDSLKMLILNNLFTQFMKQNLLTLNFLGLFPLIFSREEIIKLWAIAPSIAFLSMSFISILG